jgi:hypothetical protein
MEALMSLKIRCQGWEGSCWGDYHNTGIKTISDPLSVNSHEATVDRNTPVWISFHQGAIQPREAAQGWENMIEYQK